nr:MAG TPA: hypothetical protein [Caudoviricetes sp.]DAV16719.1 MAG TPA: hypothetical protein [Caudoviricetes sp.]
MITLPPSCSMGGVLFFTIFFMFRRYSSSICLLKVYNL